MTQRYIIGIGAQKAGTTWLADYFSHHPEIFMSPIKELHFFDVKYRPDLCKGFEARMKRDFKALRDNKPDLNKAKRIRLNALHGRVRMNGDLEKYQEYFAKRAKPGQVLCEITPEYALLDNEGFSAIRSLADDVRVIFLMRNPVDRFWSALRMWNKKHPEAKTIDRIDDFLVNPQFVGRTNYQKTVETIHQVFSPANIFIGFYENLFTSESLKKICDFSGIAYIEPDFDKRVHEGVQKGMDTEIREKILRHFGPIYEWGYGLYGEELPASWLDDLQVYKTLIKA